MKKIILIAFFAITCTAIQAQFGVKAGLAISTWAGDDVDEDGKESLLGIYLGVFYNIAAGEHFSIQPEATFATQGVKYSAGGEEFKIATSHINVTPVLRYNAEGGFFAGLGPQLGFLLAAKAKAEGEDDVDIKDEFKGMDIALAILIGYDLENGLGFYARYNHGLTQIPDLDDTKVFNRSFQFGLRWTFHGAGEAKKK